MGRIYTNNITGMNKTISNLGSQITVNFNPPILLDNFSRNDKSFTKFVTFDSNLYLSIFVMLMNMINIVHFVKKIY